MARNEEKAQSMLNRYITLKNEEKKKPRERRPFLASECRDLAEASKAKEILVEEERQRERELLKEKSEKEMEFVAHVPLPDDKEIEKKKKDLLSRYVSEELMQDQTEAKQMLNIKR